jgi:flagellin-like hook-associated protein FlgL
VNTAPAAPTSAERRVALGETLHRLSQADGKAGEATAALDLATSRLFGRGADTAALDEAARHLEAARASLGAAEKLVREFALR